MEGDAGHSEAGRRSLVQKSLRHLRIGPEFIVEVDRAEGIRYGDAEQDRRLRGVSADLVKLVFVIVDKESQTPFVEIADILFPFYRMGVKDSPVIDAQAPYELEFTDRGDVETAPSSLIVRRMSMLSFAFTA